MLDIVASFCPNRKKTFFALYGIITFLFYALRSRYLGSGDANFYFNFWEKLSNIPLSTENISLVCSYDFEEGFLFTTWLLSHIFPNGQFVFVFSAAIFAFCLCSFFSKNCNDHVMGSLMAGSIGLTAFFLQGLRQSLAISICLLSVRYCKQKKLLKFFSVIIIATLFHSSALVFVLAYIAYGVELNWKSMLWLGILAIVWPIVLNIITLLANFFMNENYAGGNTEYTTGGIITLSMYLSLLLYLVISRNEIYKCGDCSISYIDYSHAFFMFMLCVIFFSLRFFYITVFERASYYFLPFAPVAICATYPKYTEKNRLIVRLVFYTVFVLLALYKSNSEAPLAAYQLFWNDN